MEERPDDMAAGTRIEHDSLGALAVPADRYWGAQTQRSVDNFPIGRDRFRWGRELIEAFGLVKWAAATVNEDLGTLAPGVAAAIRAAAEEVIDGSLDAHFPLVVWQTGSGTQTNMNANEVLANRAIELAGGVLGAKDPVHPNDHVNRGQSSNDVFPTAMHVAAVLALRRRLLPALGRLTATLAAWGASVDDVVVVGRTHLQDATPIRLSQVAASWAAQLRRAGEGVERAMDGLHRLAIGATAVGTGVNTHPRFGVGVSTALARRTGEPFVQDPDLGAAIAAHDAMVDASAALRTLAGAAMKVANDIRWYASGPRAGIGELVLPANEPGSSIMPGKVNPTQAEALSMVAVQVFGNDAAVAFAGSQGNFQLNVYKPVIAHNVLESIGLLADALDSFDRRCASGLDVDRSRIRAHLRDSLMPVTALAPHIGYDAAAAIAKAAHESGASLRDAALASGSVSAEEFDAWVRPRDLTVPDGPG